MGQVSGQSLDDGLMIALKSFGGQRPNHAFQRLMAAGCRGCNWRESGPPSPTIAGLGR